MILYIVGVVNLVFILAVCSRLLVSFLFWVIFERKLQIQEIIFTLSDFLAKRKRIKEANQTQSFLIQFWGNFPYSVILILNV